MCKVPAKFLNIEDKVLNASIILYGIAGFIYAVWGVPTSRLITVGMALLAFSVYCVLDKDIRTLFKRITPKQSEAKPSISRTEDGTIKDAIVPLGILLIAVAVLSPLFYVLRKTFQSTEFFAGAAITLFGLLFLIATGVWEE